MKPVILICGQIGPKYGWINLLLGMWVHEWKQSSVVYNRSGHVVVCVCVCAEEMKLIFLGQVRSNISENLFVVVNLVLSN